MATLEELSANAELIIRLNNAIQAHKLLTKSRDKVWGFTFEGIPFAGTDAERIGEQILVTLESIATKVLQDCAALGIHIDPGVSAV